MKNCNKKYEQYIEKEILYSLYRKKYFGKRHTPIKNLCGRLSYIPCKKINKIVKKLFKKGLIGIKNTSHDKDIYLNISRKKEIEEIISDLLDELYEFN
ncbi:hypothetical protein [Methanobrevibacter sp. DSM 116169]|uniref:hypothetical protein n=1 Tax=Methanobrevibacter sp. DSM 116169 TaxID=3242727 RepID=UPI0038FCF5FA